MKKEKTAETLYRLWYSNWNTNIGFGKTTLELDTIFDEKIDTDVTYKNDYYRKVDAFLNSLNQVSGKFT